MGKSRGILFVLALGVFSILAEPAFAARKDFKGLFGSYRQPRFTENEGRDTDFGFDIMLSTMLPLSPVISSQESVGGAVNPLQSSMFFNGEGSVFVSLNYHWEFYGSVGYYTYESRKQSVSTGATDVLPRFHQFELSAIPMILGVRYRLNREDFVPYFGLGLGMSRVHRRSFYDFNSFSGGLPLQDENFSTVVTAQLTAGVEFYFASRAGIRLEASAYYMRLPAAQWQPAGGPQPNAWMYYGANPWFIRYASGLFFLF
jgi:opacity protein-like surface antigen